ncbi:unknown [Prevotella sp. CAG:873]|nr:unknown [Prevotella sp. CAG:873]
MYAYEADFLAFGGEVVYGFFGGLCDAAHCNDYAVGILGSVVAEQVVFATGDFGDFGHVSFDDVGHGVIVSVAGFAVLEEHVAVFGHTA